MPDNTVSPELLEPALPGAWIAEHRRIWQMNFLNAYDLARFCYDRGLADFGEKGITQLWQLGLLKADLVESDEELSYNGLVDRGVNRYGAYMYSDERHIQQRPEGWGNAVKTLSPLRDDVELLFHPFRYYVLYHLNREVGTKIHKMLMFNQERIHELLDISLSWFNRWTASEQFISRFQLRNDIASLAVITEPCTYGRIFEHIRYDPSELKDYQAGAKEIEDHIAEYWHSVNKLYHQIGLERLEETRQEICGEIRKLDSNLWIHTLLCAGDGQQRLELKDRLGGALLLRTMAEMLRHAADEAFHTTLQEEDEYGPGSLSKAIKENLFGSKSGRLLDDLRALRAFARWHGQNYKPRVHLYCEGNTEYGALTSIFKSLGVPVTNLYGLIRVKEGKAKEEKSMATYFRDSLLSDIQDHICSIVIIDKDRRENVRILERAAKNNQTSEDDGIFGTFFLSNPDFEFENFEIEELEEVLWKWVGGESPSQEDREQLHNNVKAARGSTEFFNGVKRTALSIPQLIEYDKGEAWGEELMKFAWEHQFKRSRKRQIIEAVELALYWEKTAKLEPYETAKKRNMVDPQTGSLVKRSPPDM
jgi:hypothetical protein